MMTWDEFVDANDLRELVDAVRKDNAEHGGGTPCCHWGRHSDDLERVVVAMCLIYQDSSGEDYADPERIEGVVGPIVNDSDGRHASAIIDHRHALPDGFFDYLESNRFTDGDEVLEAKLAIADRVASKAYRALHALLPLEAGGAVVDLVPIFQAAVDVAWSEIFDYWAEKDGW